MADSPTKVLSEAAAAIAAAEALGERRSGANRRTTDRRAEDRWITASEYGEKYGASKNTMQKWMRAGLVDFVRVRCPGDRRDTIRVRDLPPGRAPKESSAQDGSTRVNLEATG